MVITLQIPPFSGYCFINSSFELPDDVFAILDECLSDYVQNYDRTDKYLSGEWDGKFHLFRVAKNGTPYFPVGYLDDVAETLRSFGFEVRMPRARLREADMLDLEWRSPLKLRQYQRDIIRSLMLRNDAATIEIPTGAGKTLIALRYAYLRQCKFIVLVHRKELLTQWRDEIEATFGITPTLVGDGAKDVSGVIVVAMVQTLRNLVADGLKLSFPLAIFDEAHTVPADTVFQVATRLGSRWRIGLSATARRTDGKDKMIWGATGPIIGRVSVETLVEQGYLATPVFRLIRAPLPDDIPKDRDTYQTVYKKGITRNTPRNEVIANCAQWGMKHGRIVFINVRHIKHGTDLMNMIPGSVFVHGSTRDRETIMEAFKHGEVPCMISTLLKEGVNAPKADLYINAAGGQSFISTIQSAGRTLRIAPGKENTILIDFSDEGHWYLLNDTRIRFSAYGEVYGSYFQNATVRELN